MHKLSLLALAALLPGTGFAQQATPILHRARSLRRIAPRSRLSPAAISGRRRWPAARPTCWCRIPPTRRGPCIRRTARAWRSSPTGPATATLRAESGTGALQRITFDDAAEQLDGWSRDGKFLYFSSSAQDVAGMNDIFRISAEGGMPVAVIGRPRMSTSSSRRLRRTGNRSPSRRAATRRASGGGTATATSTSPRSGSRPLPPRRNTRNLPAAISNACGLCGAATARASTT